MWYRKNIYQWEQAIRVIGGLAFAAYAIYAFPASLLSYVLIASGIFFAMTGIVGWCPMCAVAGRRIAINRDHNIT